MDKTILPKPKPKNYKKTLEMLNTKAAANTFSPKTYINLVGEFAKKAYDNNELSEKEYMNIVKPLFGDAGIMASEKIEDYRKKFDLGGSTDYRAMVTRMYILSGGQEKTGMDIESFAKQYFPREENNSGSGNYADKYLKYADKNTQDRFNRIVNDLRTDMSLESAISEALREIRSESKQ